MRRGDEIGYHTQAGRTLQELEDLGDNTVHALHPVGAHMAHVAARLELGLDLLCLGTKLDPSL